MEEGVIGPGSASSADSPQLGGLDDVHTAGDDASTDLVDQPPPAKSPLVSLTQLKPVPVANVWPTEAQHFTPWLLENAELLSEVLGIDVELESREYKVGKFSLDIIGREVATGNPVIIENQYGPTDHNHLGQILTYAGGTKPTTVVWVAEEFREEHRAALEWLNTHTDTTIRFFGVRLAAVTMTGAPAGLIAPFLELVVKPNEWEKVAAAAAASGTAGRSPATQELYRQFWSQFEPLAKQRGWTTASAPTQNWWNMPAGLSGAIWGVSYATFGCRSELYFQDPDPDVNLARWSVLNDKKSEITDAFRGELFFDDLPNNKGCRIEARLNGPKIADKAQWPAVLNWMIESQERLRKAVAAVGRIPTVTAATGDSGADQLTEP
jgi:hypothetical protein